jgi:hypothetical protein
MALSFVDYNKTAETIINEIGKFQFGQWHTRDNEDPAEPR